MAINRGIDIQEKALGISLIPNMEYTYDAKQKVKMLQGQIDIGAFEYQGAVALSDHHENRFELFPNPVNSTLTIRSNLTLNTYPFPVIYNLSGQKCKVDFFKSDDQEFHADLSQIPSGIYI
ncbi:MAG: T9SS type A sorting domain-containing protein, partial [Saprospiraceae bacterium]|nr:T9SS type A sorting domain-containing protein [Saprospiraceae bacterium]